MKRLCHVANPMIAHMSNHGRRRREAYLTDSPRSSPGLSPLWLLGAVVGVLGVNALGKGRRPPERNERGIERGARSTGSYAAAPQEVPVPGWKAVLTRTFHEVTDDHVMLVAAGVTFYTLLALFPALAALVSVYGLFGDPAVMREHVVALEGVIPDGAVSVISDQIEALAANGSTALGLSFAIGLGVSLWSANSGVKSIFEALNIAYEEKETRSFVKLTLISLSFTLGGLVFVLLALGAVIALPAVVRTMALGGLVETLLTGLRWPVLLVVVAGLIALLYRYGPSRRPPDWRWVSWGSAIAAGLWVVLSALFSWYAANFGSYNATYGSLGAIVGFMTWIWLSVIVVITCAELNSELEHQTGRDTTAGPDRPMGQRGAVMADRVVGGLDRSEGRDQGL